MAYKIIVKEPAKDDTQEAYDHYENIKEGLGEDFLKELLSQFDDIAGKPHNYGFIDDQAIIRDVKINRFPYTVIFDIINEEVIVYAVHSTYRHPKRRLRKL